MDIYMDDEIVNLRKHRHREMYDIFMKQDYENEYYDVIFYVEGEELYAHGFILSAASPIFKEQLLKNRLKGNEPIQIDDYTFNEFAEFIRLLYLPDDLCDGFGDKHIYALIKLAHIYEVDEIIEECRYFFDFHSDKPEDVFECIEIVHKYSLITASTSIEIYLDQRFSTLIDSAEFLNLEMSLIKTIVTYALKVIEPGEVCAALYKWAKHQAMITEETPEEEKDEIILHLVKDILPIFEFEKMSLKYLLENVVTTGLISIDVAKKLKTMHLTLTSHGKAITGTFLDDYGIFDYIQSHETCELIDRGIKSLRLSYKCFKIPTTSSTVENMKGCEWYLLLTNVGKLKVKHQSLVKKTDYLLAEMKEMDEGDFVLDKNSDISITVSCNEKVVRL